MRNSQTDRSQLRQILGSHSRTRALAMVAGAAAGVALAGSAARASEITFETIALTDAPAPGLPGVTFARLDSPRLSEAGEFAFWARLAGEGVTEENDGSVWSARSGALALVYREADPAPLDADIRFGSFPFPAFNAAAEFSFTASIYDPGLPNQPTRLGIFREVGGDIFTVAAEGDGPSPTLSLAPFNAAGHVAWHEVLPYAKPDQPRFGNLNSTALGGVIAAGDPAPGLPGYIFNFIDSPSQNAGSAVAFRATIAEDLGGGKLGEAVPSVWEAGGGGLQLIAWADPEPGPDGLMFTDFSTQPRIAGGGAVTFWARLAGEGVDETNDGSLWRATGGSPALIAREGGAAPGGGTYGVLSRTMAHNAAGQAVFAATLAGAGSDENTAIYLAKPGAGVSRIARENDPAPGLAGDVRFALFDAPAISDSGGIVVGAHLRGDDAGPGDNYALFAAAAGAPLSPVLRVGDPFQVADGDVRTIREIIFSSDESQTGYSQFTGDGTLIFRLMFEDKSEGLFTATLESGTGCPADMDGDGDADLFDFLAFFNLFNSQNPAADCDGNGVFTLFDFLCFTNLFNQGC